MREISFFIDSKSISDELSWYRGRSFDNLSRLEIMDDTPSNPPHTDTIIDPKISILEPDKTTEVETRNIRKNYITVSDTLIRDNLSYLLIVHISDHERWSERWDRKREEIENIYENKENYTSYNEKWDAEFFHKKKYSWDLRWFYISLY